MPTRRHFITHTARGLGALVLAPTLSRAATTPTGLWTFKIKSASLPISPAYRIGLTITVARNTILEIPEMGTPLSIPAKEATLTLPLIPPPSLYFNFRCSKPGDGTSLREDTLACTSTTNSITGTIESARVRKFSYRATSTVDVTNRIIEVEFVPHERVSP